MPMRGVRGATVVESDQSEVVLEATRELLTSILRANPLLEVDDLASAFFTVTDDIRSVYPAKAARQIGWTQVPLMCAVEIPVHNSLKRCIRVLLHWNTDLPQSAIHPIYLGQAAQLRPDLASVESQKEE